MHHYSFSIFLCYRITYTHENLYYMISDIYGVGGTGKLNQNVDFSQYESQFNEVDKNNSLYFMKVASSQLDDMLV